MAADEEDQRTASPAAMNSAAQICTVCVIGASQKPCAEPANRAVGSSSPTMAPTSEMATPTFSEVRDRDVGMAEGQRSFQKICAPARMIGAHQVELDLLGAAQPLHHADGDGEEGKVGRNQRLRQQAGDAGGIEKRR